MDWDVTKSGAFPEFFIGEWGTNTLKNILGDFRMWNTSPPKDCLQPSRCVSTVSYIAAFNIISLIIGSISLR